VEFKPAGDVLNQTSEHQKIHISISKRFLRTIEPLQLASHNCVSLNLKLGYGFEKMRKIFTVQCMAPYSRGCTSSRIKL